MKFTNGYWLLKTGVSATACMDLHDIKITQTCVTLYVASAKIDSRAHTLDCPILTLRFTSPLEGILQLSMTHFEGAIDKGPSFQVEDSNCSLTVQESEKELTIASGKLVAHICKEIFRIEYFYDGKFLTASLPKQLAYMKTPEGPFCRERLLNSVDEYYYGFGERFTPFVKNGQSIEIWNEDGGTASEQTYKNVPFCISNRGYGVFVNHPEAVSYEVCSEMVSRLQFSVKGENLRYMIIGGSSLFDVLSNYTAITGRPALPPAWSYGLWLSTSFTTDYNEETVTSFIEGMSERDIPLSVFHYDCFWMKDSEWCNFTWDADSFPDPVGMLARLKSKGLKICVWINPYIAQKSLLFHEAVEKGYLIKKPDGSVWQWNLWQAGMGIVDFTNPEAVVWYQNHLRRLMAEGVDCFKTDFGERIPVDVIYYDGSDPEKMHNYYAYLYNKAVFTIVEEVRGKKDAVVFARSSTAGGQQFPVHWGGDCEANYESMAESLRGGMSLSMCGFGYWSHDISGFEFTATPDLYKRWVAFGLFSSHSRLHGSISYRVPWLFDEESVDVLRFFTKQKCRLMPYIFAAGVIAHHTGVPVMRPMVLAFPNDPGCGFLDKQYMFGENLLVAPVFNTEGTTCAYLPDIGTWTNWLTNDCTEGGRFIQEKHDYYGLGLWVRPNSVIVTGALDNTPEYDYADNSTLHIFELLDTKVVIYDKEGLESITVELKKAGNTITVKIKGEHKGFNLLFRNNNLKADEIACTDTSLGTDVRIPSGCKEVVLKEG